MPRVVWFFLNLSPCFYLIMALYLVDIESPASILINSCVITSLFYLVFTFFAQRVSGIRRLLHTQTVVETEDGIKSQASTYLDSVKKRVTLLLLYIFQTWFYIGLIVFFKPSQIDYTIGSQPLSVLIAIGSHEGLF